MYFRIKISKCKITHILMAILCISNICAWRSLACAEAIQAVFWHAFFLFMVACDLHIGLNNA